jgi:hypothetical protein
VDDGVWVIGDQRDLERYIDQVHSVFVARGVRAELVAEILDSNPPPLGTDWTEWLHEWAPGAASRLNSSLKLARLRDLVFRFADGDALAGEMLPLAAEDYASGVMSGPNLKVAWACGFRTGRERSNPNDSPAPCNPYRATPGRLAQLFTRFERGDMESWHWFASKVVHDLTGPAPERSAAVAWERGYAAGIETFEASGDVSKNPYS